MERTEVEKIIKNNRGILTRLSEELGIGVSSVRAVLVAQERPGPHVWQAFHRMLAKNNPTQVSANNGSINQSKGLEYFKERESAWAFVYWLASGQMSHFGSNARYEEFRAKGWSEEKIANFRKSHEDLSSPDDPSIKCTEKEAIAYLNSFLQEMGYKILKVNSDWQSISQGDVEPLREATYKEVDAAMVKAVAASIENPIGFEARLAKLESQHKDWDDWANDTQNVINEWREAADKRLDEQDDKIERLEILFDAMKTAMAAQKPKGFFGRWFK